MEITMLEKVKKQSKFIITEKEVTYRSARRHKTSSRKYILDSPATVTEFLEGLFDKSPVEVLYAIALNSSNEFLGITKISTGTVDRAAVYPRGLLSFLLVETNATALILAHNHPGGSARASKEDIALTQRIETLLKDLDVRLLDHLIYASGRSENQMKWTSVREVGILS